ncbi:phosphoenolpyruvate--protein phosphotransferase [Mycoplasmatota bacterium WC44]
MVLKGIGAANGIQFGKAYKLEKLHFKIEKEEIFEIDIELDNLSVAIAKSKEEINLIKEISIKKFGEETAQVFSAHLLILEDQEMYKSIVEKITNEKVSASYAIYKVREQFVSIFENMDNDYMKERAADIKDVTDRVLAHLTRKKIPTLSLIDEEVILVSEDLTPSDTAQLDKNVVLGFVTEIGGQTSHTAIMARALEIPAIVGTKTLMESVVNDDYLIIDGDEGIVIINPTKDELETYHSKKSKLDEKHKLLQEYVDKKTLTVDGKEIELVNNIGSAEEVESVIKNGAEGVGLFRTEFLFMGRTNFPTEEEQFVAYKKVLETMGDKTVVIRTLDIGGDKELSYFKMNKELNPFLGVRAIRLCLDRVDIFSTQLRALLRASKYGNLHIMFPMIATINELREAKTILNKCKHELIDEGYEIGVYKVGMMMEIPSAAISADIFASEVDFFSIGTNDLIQYTMAADRMNEGVSYLYQPYNPSILRLIKNVIDSSHNAGIWTGMCGEMANDFKAIPILLGLGLDEFSVSPSLTLEVRKLLSTLNKSTLKEKANKALTLASAEEVKALYE